jgi:hypothetical protein
VNIQSTNIARFKVKQQVHKQLRRVEHVMIPAVKSKPTMGSENIILEQKEQSSWYEMVINRKHMCSFCLSDARWLNEIISRNNSVHSPFNQHFDDLCHLHYLHHLYSSHIFVPNCFDHITNQQILRTDVQT